MLSLSTIQTQPILKLIIYILYKAIQLNKLVSAEALLLLYFSISAVAIKSLQFMEDFNYGIANLILYIRFKQLLAITTEEKVVHKKLSFFKYAKFSAMRIKQKKIERICSRFGVRCRYGTRCRHRKITRVIATGYHICQRFGTSCLRGIRCSHKHRKVAYFLICSRFGARCRHRSLCRHTKRVRLLSVRHVRLFCKNKKYILAKFYKYYLAQFASNCVVYKYSLFNLHSALLNTIYATPAVFKRSTMLLTSKYGTFKHYCNFRDVATLVRTLPKHYKFYKKGKRLQYLKATYRWNFTRHKKLQTALFTTFFVNLFLLDTFVQKLAILSIHAIKNNVFTTITSLVGDVLHKNTAGSIHNKEYRLTRNRPYPAKICGEEVAKVLVAGEYRYVIVRLHGIKRKRRITLKAITKDKTNTQYRVLLLTDYTTNPHNGCRSFKKRRK